MRIEYIVRVSWVKNVEEECKILKGKIFLNQFTIAESQVFEFALDRYSGRDMQLILSKGENTIRSQRQHIIRKLGVSSMKQAVGKLQNLAYESPRKFLQSE
jgi:DNA-binding CsgD family transcriptional regulator